MIYLTHPGGAFAACEDAAHAAPYEAHGYTRCSAREFSAAWAARDAADVARLRGPELERAVGETVPLGGGWVGKP